MTIAYFDCFSGVSGDMVLGAMVDAGMPLQYLLKQLKSVKIGEYNVTHVRDRRGICGTNLQVETKGPPCAEDYPSLDALIMKSSLSKPIRETARAIFAKLARAEAIVHGISVDQVHFHEVGAIDSIIDVVGAAIGIDYFDFSELFSSPLPMGRGHVKCCHGMLPVPAPATLEILKGIPVESTSVREEIVTPTGAAILTTVVSKFGECPLQKLERVGYGFGDKIIPGIPNALRLMVGEGFPVVTIESDIDDMNPELFAYTIDKMFEAGAVDVHLESIQMKKNRPAARLSAIVPWQHKDKVIEIILRETTSFGVRYWPTERRVLTRELVKKELKKGSITFKIGRDISGGIVKVMPEYEDVKKLARKTKRPIIEIYQEALAMAAKLRGSREGS